MEVVVTSGAIRRAKLHFVSTVLCVLCFMHVSFYCMFLYPACYAMLSYAINAFIHSFNESNHHHQQSNTQLFAGQTLAFLSPNQQRQSTEGKRHREPGSRFSLNIFRPRRLTTGVRGAIYAESKGRKTQLQFSVKNYELSFTKTCFPCFV